MDNLKFVKEHNVVSYLRPEVPEGKEAFLEAIQFLSRTRLAYALCVYPVIAERFIKRFWRTAQVEVANDVTQIRGEFAQNREITITEASIRTGLRFGEDSEYTIEYEEAEILQCFEDIGYEGGPVRKQLLKGQISSRWRFIIHCIQHSLSKRKSGWNDMTYRTASILVSLVENRGFNMSRYIFNGMKMNIEEDRRNKFLMYPRFIQCLINEAFPDLIGLYNGPTLRVLHHDSKVFAYLTRTNARSNFSGIETDLTQYMKDVASGVIVNGELKLIDEPINMDDLIEEEPVAQVESSSNNEDGDNVENVQAQDGGSLFTAFSIHYLKGNLVGMT